jgi:hypothetical protein
VYGQTIVLSGVGSLGFGEGREMGRCGVLGGREGLVPGSLESGSGGEGDGVEFLEVARD